MSSIKEGIIIGKKNLLCFGDYEIIEKLKISDFEFNGDIYKVKTHKEITKLEKNGNLALETVPGAAIYDLDITENGASFSACGFENTQITLELESNTEYKVLIDDENTGKMKSNVSGKITVSADLSADAKNIKIIK